MAIIVISSILFALCCVLLGIVIKLFNYADDKLNNEKQMHEKAERYKAIVIQWLKLKNEGINLSKYFSDRNYEKIAIYGYSELGQMLEGEIENTKINLTCFIDKNADKISVDKKIINPNEIEQYIKSIDAVVITPVVEFEKIKETLTIKMLNKPIISLEDVVFDI